MVYQSPDGALFGDVGFAHGSTDTKSTKAQAVPSNKSKNTSFLSIIGEISKVTYLYYSGWHY